MGRIELHVFGDSSQEVFSAVAFLRGQPSDLNETSTHLAFVLGRARVAPMKTLTVPKLELQAALLAARLSNEIHSALTTTIEKTYLWADSTTVLQWLNSLDKQPIFVANRVSEILELTTVDQWNYIATSENPADAGTRGLSADALKVSSWFNGPEFLRTPDFPFQVDSTVLQSIKNRKVEQQLCVYRV